MSKTHEIKISKLYAERILAGEKTCEVRFNDRDYQKGDQITLNDFHFEITHVLYFPEALKPGWVVLSLRRKEKDNNQQEGFIELIRKTN